MSRTLKIVCPCCDSLIVVNPATGAILRADRQEKREHQSLDDVLDHVRSQKNDARDRLTQAINEERHREEILEKKFQEARRKAAENPDEAPPHPFEGD